MFASYWAPTSVELRFKGGEARAHQVVMERQLLSFVEEESTSLLGKPRHIQVQGHRNGTVVNVDNDRVLVLRDGFQNL